MNQRTHCAAECPAEGIVGRGANRHTYVITKRRFFRRFSCRAQELEKTREDFIYKTSSTDVAMIGICRKAYGRIAECQSKRDWKDGDETYAGMVEVSRALMKARRL